MAQPDFVIRPMQISDIRQVSTIERKAFTMPWPSYIYVHEINHNKLASMGVIEAATPLDPDDEANSEALLRLGWLGRRRAKPILPLAAYGGVWEDGSSGHISTLASAPRYRGQGFGELMLLALMGQAIVRGMKRFVLEVRVGNVKAQNLYQKYHFSVYETHYAYYHDNDEDAYVMVTPDIDDDYQDMLRQHIAALYERISFEDRFSGWTNT
jgi:ribosomal-protein-alanine N-acetyltransferase